MYSDIRQLYTMSVRARDSLQQAPAELNIPWSASETVLRRDTAATGVLRKYRIHLFEKARMAYHVPELQLCTYRSAPRLCHAAPSAYMSLKLRHERTSCPLSSPFVKVASAPRFITFRHIQTMELLYNERCKQQNNVII